MEEDHILQSISHIFFICGKLLIVMGIRLLKNYRGFVDDEPRDTSGATDGYVEAMATDGLILDAALTDNEILEHRVMLAIVAPYPTNAGLGAQMEGFDIRDAQQQRREARDPNAQDSVSDSLSSSDNLSPPQSPHRRGCSPGAADGPGGNQPGPGDGACGGRPLNSEPDGSSGPRHHPDGSGYSQALSSGPA